MTAPHFLGIDGGGTSLRIAIVDAAMTALASLRENSANPGIVGREPAQAHIRQAVRAALHEANLTPANIAAAGFGIAGASNRHSRHWLLQTLKPVLPGSLLVPSSDLEIALVGALAQRHGILLLAGTGSAVFGNSPDGAQLQIGGWGYLLGDEGSGYWIGSRLLRRIVRDYDSAAKPEQRTLEQNCLAALGFSEPRDLVQWVYRADEAPAVRIAGLAQLVLRLADAGIWPATDILQAAAFHLADQVKLLQRRLAWPAAPIAFAGGLLDHANVLSADVARRLDLPRPPTAQFTPVLGAALLAKSEWSDTER